MKTRRLKKDEESLALVIGALWHVAIVLKSFNILTVDTYPVIVKWRDSKGKDKWPVRKDTTSIARYAVKHFNELYATNYPKI